MRKIDNDAAVALVSLRPFIRGNTTVTVSRERDGEEVATMLLHGNAIARVTNIDGWGKQLAISLAGWPTRTTRSRLNAVIDWFSDEMGYHARLYQRDYDQRMYITFPSGVEIDRHMPSIGWQVLK